MAPWPCTRSCGRSSARPPSSSGAKVHAPQHPRCRSASARGSRRLCDGPSGACVDGDAAPHGSRHAPGGRLSQRRRQRPRRAGRNADRFTLRLSTRLRGISPRQHAETAGRHPYVRRSTVRTVQPPLGGRRCSCRQGLPAPECGDAAFGQRATRTRDWGSVSQRRTSVESHPSRRRISTAVGTSPCGCSNATRS